MRRRPLLSRVVKFRLAGLLAAWMAALFVVAWLVSAGREVAFERGEHATAAIAALVAQQVSRTFQTINLTLGAIAEAHQLSPRPGENDFEFQQMMSRRLKDVPFVRAVFIIGPDGLIIHDTNYPGTPPVSLADREYFRAYQVDPARAGMAWPPLLSRASTGSFFVPVTRALGRAGSFEGVVVAAIQATYFAEQLSAVGLPAGYLVALFHFDGTLVASYPALGGDTAKDDRPPEMFALAKSDFGSSFTQGLLPGTLIVSYRTVEGAPIVVRVSRGARDLLAEWRRTATAAMLAMLALTIFLGWAIVRLARASARRAREREARMQHDKLHALGELAGGMAHDFANLLHVVGMNVHLLRTKPDDRPVVEDALAAVERAVRRGAHVAERLLAFARRKPLTLTPVRLNTWLEAVHPLLAQAVGSRVALDVQSEQPLPEILCDVGELDLALLNLVINARDAMAGSGRIGVRIYPCHEESEAPKAFIGKPARFVCLTVKDDGPGMTKEVRQRALEPFYTTKGEAGNGLGLSQVYGFMQQLGGQMIIDSTPGHGTAVHLFFPVAPDVGVKS